MRATTTNSNPAELRLATLRYSILNTTRPWLVPFHWTIMGGTDFIRRRSAAWSSRRQAVAYAETRTAPPDYSELLEPIVRS